jgi:hypothetical protein
LFQASEVADAYCLVTKTTTLFLGNDFFVTKRYFFSRCSEDELLARAKRRIRSPNEAQAESTLVHGDVALDLLTRRVIAAGSQPQALSMIERQEISNCWSSFFVAHGKLFLESSYSQVFGA